jgi:hypothetical protein
MDHRHRTQAGHAAPRGVRYDAVICAAHVKRWDCAPSKRACVLQTEHRLESRGEQGWFNRCNYRRDITDDCVIRSISNYIAAAESKAGVA